MSNTEMVGDGTELYIHRLFELADEYISECLAGDEEKMPDYFRDFIFYAHDRIEIPGHADIWGLDALFSAYSRLCARYRKLPTIEAFSLLTGINPATFTDWKNGEYRNKLYYTLDGEQIDNISMWRTEHKGEECREVPSSAHSKAVQKWKDICKNFVVDELTNNNQVNPNLIFIAKANHGLRETAPLPAPEPEHRRIMSMDELPVLGGGDDVGKADALPYLGDEWPEMGDG